MRILLIRFSSIGDIVLQTPVASWLKQQFPNSKVSFLTAKEFTSVLDGHPHIDQVIGMERFRGKGQLQKLYRFSRDLIGNEKFDLIIDLHSNTRSRLIGWFNPSVKIIRVDKRKFERNLLVWSKQNRLKKTASIHWRNIQDIAPLLGKTSDLDSFKLFMKELSPMLNATSLAGSKEVVCIDEHKTIVISAIASFAAKRWPIAKFQNLIDEILRSKKLQDYQVKVLGGKDDDYLLPLKQFETNARERFEYLQGKTSLAETIEIIKSAKVCVGNDTGLGHIAEAFGIPSIVLFGPTHPDFGFGTHGDHSKNIWIGEPCSPCSTLGDKPCKFATQNCMEKIQVNTVLQEITKVCAL